MLVVWQLASCKSHYRPRLGAQITRVACSPTDQSFAISLQNNSEYCACRETTTKFPVLGSCTTVCIRLPSSACWYLYSPCYCTVIQVVSGLDNNVEWSLGGMRRAHTQDPKENGTRTGLLWDPRSLSIVANSNPGCLQWYRPEVDLVSSQVTL